MSNRKATPDVLGEILTGESALPAVDSLPTVDVPTPSSRKPSRPRPPRQRRTPAKDKVQAWEYLELTLRDYRGWRPRLVNGLPVEEWKDGPEFRTFLERLGSEGWEMVGIVSSGRSEREAYFKRPRG